ncbi:hypothetical protein QTP88_029715 [Uroleucon formosanum]
MRDKDQADRLADFLKRRFGDSRGIRRPIPSTALILIGIEDSVDEDELKSSLETHDPELKALNVIKIREGSNGAALDAPLRITRPKAVRAWKKGGASDAKSLGISSHRANSQIGMSTRMSRTKVLQVNLNHCWTAQQLLSQTVAERSVDVALICDYYSPTGNEQHWVSSTDNKCAVSLARKSSARLTEKGAGAGFAWAKINRTTFYSCYCTPNCRTQEFDVFLSGLEDSIRIHTTRDTALIVAGDLNSHSAEWGSSSDDTRGLMLSGFASSLGLHVCNVGTVPTFSPVNASSVIDVTFARSPPGTCPLVENWRVLTELESASDHLYVEYTVADFARPAAVPPASRNTMEGAWAVRKLSPSALEEYWRSTNIALLPPNAPAEDHAELLCGFLAASCNASMPRRTVFKGRRAAHWWSKEIADLRKASISARRQYQRAGRRADTSGRAGAFAAYNEARKLLRLAIRKAQEASWDKLCSSVDNDPWGVPYRLVTKQLDRRSAALDNDTALTIARGLFPSLPPVDWSTSPYVQGESTEIISLPAVGIPPFTTEDLRKAVRKLPSGKAPGPDQVPNEVIRLAAKKFPELFLAAYYACIRTGCFPTRWKRASLVLLHKGQSKPPDQPSSYRPISLLDGAGKLLERLLLARLEDHIEHAGGLSDSQYGFRKSRSTTDAIAEVLRLARDAGSGAVQNRDLCAVVTIDVNNAFNSAPWKLIDASLQRCYTPKYLVDVVRSYMSDRTLIVGKDPDPDAPSLPITCGVPQGSVLGPTLWNIFYDGILKLRVPTSVKLLAFADDVAIVAVGHNADILEQDINATLLEVSSWLSDNGLQLAPEKTECIVLTKKHSYRPPDIAVDGCAIPIKQAMRYLGVYLDTRMSFVEHARRVAVGAKAAAAALGRLMPNVGGPSQSKRQLLMSVVHSRLLYGAQVWANAIKDVEKPKNLLLQAQRCAALKVARCYRTASDMVSTLLARMPPAPLLAIERARSAELRKSGTPHTKAELRREVIRQWQTTWEKTSKSSWAKRLIPDVARWWYYGPKSVSFHMAQAISGHGCFQKYLWSRDRARSPACVHCQFPMDDAEHTIFDCPFWDAARQELTSLLGRPPRPGDVADLLCMPAHEDLPPNVEHRRRILAAARGHAESFQRMVKVILGQKEELERARQRAEALQQ